MIIQANNRMWHFEPVPGMSNADILKAMPAGAAILSASDEAAFRAVKLPSAEVPIDVNAANKFELLTIVDNNVAGADELVKLRPFSDIADLQARAGKLITSKLDVIVVGGKGATPKFSAKVVAV